MLLSIFLTFYITVALFAFIVFRMTEGHSQTWEEVFGKLMVSVLWALFAAFLLIALIVEEAKNWITVKIPKWL